MVDDTFTANLRLRKVAADRKNWSELLNANFDILDATVSSYYALPNFQGIWQNATAYAVNDLAVDSSSGIIYKVLVAHTSASIPTTFAEDRADNPSYWTIYLKAASGRGEWEPDTDYLTNDFVVSDQVYAVAIIDHTSSNDFSQDVVDGKWEILVDLSEVISPALGFISADVTYYIGAAQQFAEPGDFMEWINGYRIKPGVTVTARIIDGTIVCTKKIIGHPDGERIRWVNSGLNGSPLSGADFETYNGTWDIDPITGITTASRDTIKTLVEAQVRAKYKVIIEFPGSNLSPCFAVEDKHSGDWSNCPTLFINTGTNDYGFSSGQQIINTGGGPGGIGVFDGSCWFGFVLGNIVVEYGGSVKFEDGLSLFAGEYCVKTEFSGGVIGDDVVIIGGGSYGLRNNHGGYCYMPGVYIRGCGQPAEATNSRSLLWLHECDIQYNYWGPTANAGQIKCVRGTVKNNARGALAANSGFLDFRSLDGASTADLFGAGTPLFGINAANNGFADISGIAGFPTTLTGNDRDIYIGGQSGVQTSSSFCTYDVAEDVAGNPLLPDAVGNLTPFPNLGRDESNEDVEVSGTTLTLPDPCPRVIDIVQPSGSAGSPIIIDTIVADSLPRGQEVMLRMKNVGETVTVNDGADISLAAAQRYLSNARDCLILYRPTITNLLLEIAFKKNQANGEGATKRVQVHTVVGDFTADRDTDVVIINKVSGAATGVNMDATMNYVGSEIIVKDGKGDANSNNITITPGDSKTIDGATPYVISTNYGQVRLIYNGTEWNKLNT